MKKVELQELIQDFLTGGDAPSDVKGRYHDEVILKHMENAYGAIVFQTWMEAKNYTDYSTLDAWARNYDVNISGSAEDIWAILPFPPMQLPDNRGILQVCPQNDLTNPFIYLETNAQAVYAALEVSTVLLKPSFYLEQNPTSTGNIDTHKLVLDNVPDGVTVLKIKMIVPLSVVDLYDEIQLPAGKEEMMVRTVIELLRGKPLEDLRNDNLTTQ